MFTTLSGQLAFYILCCCSSGVARLLPNAVDHLLQSCAVMRSPNASACEAKTVIACHLAYAGKGYVIVIKGAFAPMWLPPCTPEHSVTYCGCRDDIEHEGERINWGKWAITCDDPDFGGEGCHDTGDDYGPAPGTGAVSSIAAGHVIMQSQDIPCAGCISKRKQ